MNVSMEPFTLWLMQRGNESCAIHRYESVLWAN